MSNVFGQQIKVHIEWMDGRGADIEAAFTPVVHEGVLRIQRYDSKAPGFVGTTINFPVANIRSWE